MNRNNWKDNSNLRNIRISSSYMSKYRLLVSEKRNIKLFQRILKSKNMPFTMNSNKMREESRRKIKHYKEQRLRLIKKMVELIRKMDHQVRLFYHNNRILVNKLKSLNIYWNNVFRQIKFLKNNMKKCWMDSLIHSHFLLLLLNHRVWASLINNLWAR